MVVRRLRCRCLLRLLLWWCLGCRLVRWSRSRKMHRIRFWVPRSTRPRSPRRVSRSVMARQVDVIVTNDYTQQLGSFSIDKALSGTGASLIDPATLFTVNYSVDGGPSVPVQVSVDGAPVVVSGLPFGAVVTFTEDTPTAVAGATFNGVTFSPTTVTIGNGTTVAVIATNDYTQQLGSFSIDKALSGSGASLGSGDDVVHGELFG